MELVWKDDNELFKLMKKYLYTAVVGDIMDQMGFYRQFLPPQIAPVNSEMILAGRAMTVLEMDACAQVNGHNQALNQPFGLMLAALDDLKENEVYICSGSSMPYALVGEIMASRAKYLGAAGFVVNGYIRDTRGILNLDFPVFAFGRYSQDQAPRGRVIDYRVPINIENVHINPGDIVFGDMDGVLILPQEIEREVLIRAYTKATGEKTVLNAINSGMSASNAFEKYGIM